MKKLAVTIGSVLVLFLGVMGAVGLIVRASLSESSINETLALVGDVLPVEMHAQSGEFDLAAWFSFRPSVRIQGFAVSNVEGYSEPSLFEADSVRFRVDLLSLLSGRARVDAIEVDGPVLTLEKKGQSSNLETLIKGLKFEDTAPDNTSGDSEETSFEIGRFKISSGALRVVGGGRDSLLFRDLDLSLTDFRPDASCLAEVETKLFGSGRSRLVFQGRVGPARPSSVPADGDLSIDISVEDVPEFLRRQVVGELLSEPGRSALVGVAGQLAGDLRKQLMGSFEARIENLNLGKDPEHQLPLSGEFPISLTLTNPLSQVQFDIAGEEALLRLGDGRWTGRFQTTASARRLKGTSSGSVEEVEISQMIHAFSTVRDVASGIASIPQYRLDYSARNATELSRSLKGQGALVLEKGDIGIFDLVKTLKSTLGQPEPEESEAEEGETEFTTFQTPFEVSDGVVLLSDIQVDSPDLAITGSGDFTVDQEIDFNLVLDLKDSTIPVPWTEGIQQVPFTVRGTFEEPVVRPDLRGLATQQLPGILGTLLGGKKKPKN